MRVCCDCKALVFEKAKLQIFYEKHTINGIQLCKIYFFWLTYFHNSRFLCIFAHYQHLVPQQGADDLWCLNYKIFIINNITIKFKIYD